MAEVKYHNAAGRLLALLQTLDKDKKHNQTGVKAWAAAFRCDAQLEPVLLNLTYAIQLLRETEEEIHEFRPTERIDPVWIRPIPKIQTLLFHGNLAADYQSLLVSTFESNTLGLLEFVADGLPQETAIPVTDLESIRSQANELFAEVKRSKLPEGIKKWILEMLAGIIEAINTYHIRGAKGLRKACKSMLADLLDHYGDVAEVKAKEPSLMGKLKKLLEQADTLSAAASKIDRLVNTVAKLSENPVVQAAIGLLTN